MYCITVSQLNQLNEIYEVWTLSSLDTLPLIPIFLQGLKHVCFVLKVNSEHFPKIKIELRKPNFGEEFAVLLSYLLWILTRSCSLLHLSDLQILGQSSSIRLWQGCHWAGGREVGATNNASSSTHYCNMLMYKSSNYKAIYSAHIVDLWTQ